MMEDRSSAFSGSSGYHTPLEDLPPSARSVRFASQVMEHHHHHHIDDDDEHLLSKEEEAIDKKKFRWVRHRKLGTGIAARVFRRHPRCYAFWIGMVGPLWFLVALSLLGGRFLGNFEYNGEVQSNNQAMRNRLLAKTYDQAVSDTVSYSPQACYVLFKSDIPIANLTNYWSYILEQEESLLDYLKQREEELKGAGDVIVNVTEFAAYLLECGKVADNFTNNIQANFFGDLEVSFSGDTTLNFAWSRCINETDPRVFNRIVQPSWNQVYQARPGNQSKVFRETWNAEQQRLQQEYLANYRAQNRSNARLQAFNDSIFDASAEHVCSVNVAATAWFWFTIMTTVGYGNQAPVTLEGRVLIFTFGFFSILVFAAVLAASGVITSLLVNDFAIRLKFRVLANKFVMMCVWGMLWIAWLAFIASYAMQWNSWRLEDSELTWEEGFWFAFISTTTVGLGDYYPSPEVMFVSDLLFFSLSFLLGFVLLSAFLTELTLFVGYFFPDLSEELAKRLKYVGMTPFKGCMHGPRSDFDSEEYEADMKSDKGSDRGTFAKEPEVPAFPEQPKHLPLPLPEESKFSGSMISGSFSYGSDDESSGYGQTMHA